jgi:hypothetical protein
VADRAGMVLVPAAEITAFLSFGHTGAEQFPAARTPRGPARANVFVSPGPLHQRMVAKLRAGLVSRFAG